MNNGREGNGFTKPESKIMNRGTEGLRNGRDGQKESGKSAAEGN